MENKLKQRIEKRNIQSFYILCNSKISSHVKSRYEKHLKNNVDYILLRDKVKKASIAKKQVK